MTPTVAVVGYLSLDEIVCPQGRFPEVPGGAALYAALGARAAGARARVVARAGEDFPEDVLRQLAGMGIDVESVTRAPGPSRRARLLDPGARAGGGSTRRSPHHASDGWWERTRALAPDAPLPAADVVVLTAMPATLLARHLEAAGRRGVPVVVDTSEAFAGREREALLACLDGVDLFAPSREEVRLLLPGWDPAGAALALARRARAVVLKQGADGLLWQQGEDPPLCQVSLVEQVVDGTGAGDATVGALAAGRARGLAPAALLFSASCIAARAAGGVGPAGLGLTLPLAAVI